MASVKKRPNGKWRARYRDDTGKEHARHFVRKVDAERWLATVQADMLRGTYVDPGAGRITVRDYAERWRVVQVHRPTTRLQIETHLRRHVYPVLGDRPIGGVRRSEVQSWVNLVTQGTGERKPLAPVTVEVIYRYLVAIFRAAVADRLIVSSPCVRITLPKAQPRRVVPPSTAQVEAMAAAMPARFRALVFLGAATGVRQGEAFAVEVDNVDLADELLQVRQQLVLMPREDPKVASLKTEASYRDVPLPRVLVAALRDHLAAFPPAEVKLQDTTGTAPRLRVARLLFTDERGRALRRTSFSREVWQPARSAAGLSDEFTYHDLRHYYASLLIRHGESVKVVQARLGHATAAETLDTYSHLWPDSADRTRDAVDEVLGVADSLRTGNDS